MLIIAGGLEQRKEYKRWAPLELTAPGVIKGNGDATVVLEGAKLFVAKIKGNAKSNFFGTQLFRIDGYGGCTFDLPVNTTAPYEGTVTISCAYGDSAVLGVQATGDWSIEVTTK